MARLYVTLDDSVWLVSIFALAVVFALGIAHLGHTLKATLLPGAARALRLSSFINWRSVGHVDGRSHARMRQRDKPYCKWKCLCLLFGLQAMLA